jgi:anti-sigma regulatory factor (Ser/Thr protein kinase)/transcriptional regulator with XRE-family HTH domain
MTDVAAAAPRSMPDPWHGAPRSRPAVGAGAARPVPAWLAVVDSQRLLQARRARGLSLERLAWKSGLSLATVARLEHEPRPRCLKRTLAQIAEALGEHPDAITASAPVFWHERGGDLEPEPPWTCSRSFPARPAQVGRAREFLCRILAGFPIAGDIVLICSELAANAVVHSDSARPGGRFTVRAEVREGDYAWIEVEDQGGRWAPGASPDQGGRGLAIVAALADYWDIRGDDAAWLVCARLDWPGAIGDRA